MSFGGLILDTHLAVEQDIETVQLPWPDGWQINHIGAVSQIIVYHHIHLFKFDVREPANPDNVSRLKLLLLSPDILSITVLGWPEHESDDVP